MAQGIEDIGNGFGWLYKTKPDGTTIVGVERNTNEGTKAMQQMGVTNAPIVAARSASGRIIVNSSGGAGNITNIDVLGVNQIGANITVTSTNSSVVAEQIAVAINSYTAPGYKFTATAIGNTVYMYSAPEDGSVINGSTITVSVTNPGIVTTTTNFANGSSEIGVYDTEFGYRFFIDANYNGTADPIVIGPKAVEITQYITVRGMQSGIITISKNVASDRLVGMTRSCDTTQVILSPQAGLTDICAFIQVEQFVEGDVLRIRGANPLTVVTLEDATVTTSPIATPNIYLTDANPFSLDGLNSITLQYRNDPTLGPIWVETGRSISDAPIVTTLSQFVNDCNSSLLKPGRVYFVTDLGDGTYITTFTNNTYSPTAIWIRKVPTNYAGCWRSNMAAPVVGSYYRYYQLVYKSLTGAVGSAPSTDLVNWVLEPTSNSLYYVSNLNSVQLSGIPLELAIWPVLEEKDAYGNTVIQSKNYWVTSTINAFSVFPWNNSGALSSGNYVNNSILDAANSDGAVYNNFLISGSRFVSTTLGSLSVVANNYMQGGIVQNNYLKTFYGNYINQGLVANNGTSLQPFGDINNNILDAGYIQDNTNTSGLGVIIHNNIKTAAAIKNNVFTGAGKIRYCTLDTVCEILNCNLVNSATGSIESVQLTGDSSLTFTMGVSAQEIRFCTFNGGSYTIVDAGSCNPITNSVFNNCQISNWQKYGATNCVFNNCNITGNLIADFNDCSITGWINTTTFDHSALGSITNANVVYGSTSNLECQSFDLDDPAIFSAGKLVIANKYSLYGTFNLVSTLFTPAFAINEVVGLPNFQSIVFFNLTLGATTFTFNKVSPAAWSGDLIVGAANFALASNAAGPSDYMTMSKWNVANMNMITGGVNFV